MRATLALGEFMDIAGVALCDTARRGGESFDLRYAALTALERGGPTPEYLAVLRDLKANDMLGNWSERSEHRSLFAQN